MSQVVSVTSRDNPVLKRIRLLLKDPGACRKWGQAWLEGDHLIAAAQARGRHLTVLVICESKYPLKHDFVNTSAINKIIMVPDSMMRELSTLDTPPTVGALIDMPESPGILIDAPTVVLDRLQDAGNTGTILRCAAAFGYKQVLALKGTASLWAPKTLRAGMGAHFGLSLVEGLSEADLGVLNVPLLVTSSHQGQWVHEGQLPWPCAWVMGHEGQGVAPSLQSRATHQIRIAQPGGEESLNVAAAAAICLYAAIPKA